MSLPLRFNTDLSSIPNKVPYLSAEEERVARWKARIGRHGFRIGIAWQGNPRAPIDQGRSIALAEFVPLSRLAGVRLISLQNYGLDQLALLQPECKIEMLGDDFDNGPDAFVDTAAAMESLDLIITSDTSIAHLAGALGRPTWVALKHVPDWRWMLDRDDSPWYPTMRLFRQSKRDDWRSVLGAIECELRSLLDLQEGRAIMSAKSDVRINPTAQLSCGEFVDKEGKLGDQSHTRLPDLRAAFKQALVFHRKGRLEEAEKIYRQILKTQPTHFDSLHMLGVVYGQRHEHAEAVRLIDTALTVNPKSAFAFHNRGIMLVELKRLNQALASYDEAIALKSDYAQAFKNRALCSLLAGRFEEGWKDHEWRWESQEFPSKRPNIDALPWRGEELRGRRLLVYSEQGLGDVIQFVRYLPLLMERKANVTFLTTARLARLLRPLTTKMEVISAIKQNDTYDFQCALMSLPLGFNTRLSSIPDKVPYLAAEEELVVRWKAPIGKHGFKIGIAWQGNPRAPTDQGRSIPLQQFVPLSRLPGVRLISLQKHHGLDQLARLPPDCKIETLGDDFDNGPDAFVDTAAAMESLDLVITSDTSIAHLAGALGRPAWVALKHVPDWRWMLDRDDSPWYPAMRLFRQSARDDWSSVFAAIERELRSLLDLQKGRLTTAAKSEVRINPTAQVSWGELVDKITILEIKEARLTSPTAIANVRRELAALTDAAQDAHCKNADLARIKAELRSVNETLWDIEDRIRGKEASKSFDREFIELARSVYFENDRRAGLKGQINRVMNSEIVEEKQYVDI